ncbi:MAG: VOC family protein [Dehalococcoidia bacterium]|nr:MAG: VOC family protein [Dehalococcoidia bacterium]
MHTRRPPARAASSCGVRVPLRSRRHRQRSHPERPMPFNINHIHMKAHDPKAVADWWVNAFNFTIVSDTVRDVGDRFVACRSENGITVNISGARTNETLGPGDANAHEGLEHFGFDSDNLEADLARLTALGAVVLQAPPPPSTPPVQRICFIRCPDNVRIELIQRPPAA